MRVKVAHYNTVKYVYSIQRIHSGLSGTLNLK